MKVYIAMAGANCYPSAEDDVVGVFSNSEAAWRAAAKTERSSDWRLVLECEVDPVDEKTAWVRL